MLIEKKSSQNPPLKFYLKKILMEIGRYLGNFHYSVKHSTLQDCLDLVKPSPFWSSLPCREKEMDDIHFFITKAFESEIPKIMIISGPSATGKTSVVQLCLLMSNYFKRILNLDLNQWEVDPYSTLQYSNERKLIIIDSPPTIYIHDLFSFFIENNCSIILITEKSINIKGFDEFISNMSNFSEYDENMLSIILNEKMRNVSDSIKTETLNYIAKKAFKEKQGIVGALELLRQSIQVAIHDDQTIVDKDSVDKAFAILSGLETEDPEIE